MLLVEPLGGTASQQHGLGDPRFKATEKTNVGDFKYSFCLDIAVSL
jgi:hypothetical protein